MEVLLYGPTTNDKVARADYLFIIQIRSMSLMWQTLIVAGSDLKSSQVGQISAQLTYTLIYPNFYAGAPGGPDPKSSQVGQIF